mgnify:CR=1 FL=1
MISRPDVDILSDAATVMLQNLSPSQIRAPHGVASYAQAVVVDQSGEKVLLDGDEPESELLTEKDRQTLQQETISDI